MLVARKAIRMADGIRHTGQPVPEANQWKRLDNWKRSGRVLEMPEDVHALLDSDDIPAGLATGNFDGRMLRVIEYERQLRRRPEVLKLLQAYMANGAEGLPDIETTPAADDLSSIVSGTVVDLRTALNTGDYDDNLEELDALETENKDRPTAHDAIAARGELIADDGEDDDEDLDSDDDSDSDGGE